MEGTIHAVCQQLAGIRNFLTEALKTGEVLQNDGDRAMVRQIAYQLVSVENTLWNLVVSPPTPTPNPPPNPPPLEVRADPEPPEPPIEAPIEAPIGWPGGAVPR